MKTNFRIFLIALLALSGLISGCNEDKKTTPAAEPNSGKLELKFNFTGNGEPLLLGDRFYTTNQFDTIKADDFKLYISNLRLKKADGTYYKVPKSYYLLNAAETNGKTVTIDSIPAGEYIGFQYGVGIDSVANHSILWVGRGDLSTTNGMSWDWNTGYKFILYEGAYRARGVEKVLTFHIGTNRNYMTNEILFSTINKPNLKIAHSKMARIGMGVELTGILNGPNALNIAESNIVMFDAVTTRLLAENTAKSCFSVKTVE